MPRKWDVPWMCKPLIRRRGVIISISWAFLWWHHNNGQVWNGAYGNRPFAASQTMASGNRRRNGGNIHITGYREPPAARSLRCPELRGGSHGETKTQSSPRIMVMRRWSGEVARWHHRRAILRKLNKDEHASSWPGGKDVLRCVFTI